MNAAIPPEFEAFAREMVAAGHFASVDEAVAATLRHQVAQIKDLHTEIQKGVESLDRGDRLDGDAAMRDLIAETRARHGG